MAKKSVSDEIIISALLQCDTQKEAAKRAGVTPQTIVNRMKNPEFMHKYHEAQNEIVRATTRKLANASTISADLLISTMKNNRVDLEIRLGIARDILRLARDYTKIDELQRRLSLIEYEQTKKADNISSFQQYRTIGRVMD